jgi:hypothetical protein
MGVFDFIGDAPWMFGGCLDHHLHLGYRWLREESKFSLHAPPESKLGGNLSLRRSEVAGCLVGCGPRQANGSRMVGPRWSQVAQASSARMVISAVRLLNMVRHL